jgi:hypothetical protein
MQVRRLQLVPCVPSISGHSVESAPVWPCAQASFPHPGDFCDIPCRPLHLPPLPHSTHTQVPCSSHLHNTPVSVSFPLRIHAPPPCRSVSRCLLGYPLWAIETAHASLLERLGRRLIRCSRSGLRPSHSKGSDGFHAGPLVILPFQPPPVVPTRISHPTLTFGTQAVSTRELPLLALIKRLVPVPAPPARHPYIITRPPSFPPADPPIFPSIYSSIPPTSLPRRRPRGFFFNS